VGLSNSPARNPGAATLNSGAKAPLSPITATSDEDFRRSRADGVGGEGDRLEAGAADANDGDAGDSVGEAGKEGRRCEAMLPPDSASGIAQPRITSSTSAEATAGYFSRRRRMTSGASSSGTGVAKRAARGFADRGAEHLQEKMF